MHRSRIHLTALRRDWITWIGGAACALAALASSGRAQGSDARGAASLAADTLLARLLPPGLRASVLRSAPDLSVRRADVRTSEARRRAVGFAPPAVLSVAIEDARSGRLDASSPRLDVSRELLPGAMRRALEAAADADVRESRVALAAAERQSVAQAARAFYAAVAWHTIAERLTAQDTLLSAAESAVRERFRVGDARYLDVLRLRAERLRVQSDRAAAQTEADVALLSLTALVGDSAAVAAAVAATPRSTPSILDAATASEVLPEAPSIESLVGIATDVRLADVRLAQVVAEHQLLLARQRPAATASLGVQRIAADGDRGAGLGPLLAAGISLPFTARAANRAAEEAASERTTAASVARTAAIAMTRARLVASRARYESARRRFASFDAAMLRGAREERDGALAAYRANDISLVDLLDFERALSRVELDRTRTLLDALSALCDLLSGTSSVDTTTPTSSVHDRDPGDSLND